MTTLTDYTFPICLFVLCVTFSFWYFLNYCELSIRIKMLLIDKWDVILHVNTIFVHIFYCKQSESDSEEPPDVWDDEENDEVQTKYSDSGLSGGVTTVH